jgi:hypothetical protein
MDQFYAGSANARPSRCPFDNNLRLRTKRTNRLYANRIPCCGRPSRSRLPFTFCRNNSTVVTSISCFYRRSHINSNNLRPEDVGQPFRAAARLPPGAPRTQRSLAIHHKIGSGLLSIFRTLIVDRLSCMAERYECPYEDCKREIASEDLVGNVADCPGCGRKVFLGTDDRHRKLLKET